MSIVPVRIGRLSEWQLPRTTLAPNAVLNLTLQPEEGVFLFLRGITFSGFVLPSIFHIKNHGNIDFAPHELIVEEDVLTLGIDFERQLPEVNRDNPVTFTVTNTDTVDRDFGLTVWWIQADEVTAKEIRARRVRP